MRLRPSHTAVMIGGFGTIIGSMPSMLTGALAPELTAALSFSVAGLGGAVAVQNAIGAVTSAPLGALVDRLGATKSVRLAMALTAFVALGIATFTRHFIVLAILLIIGGLSKRIMEPASNRLLVTMVGPRRLGLAFGIKQAAPPAAVMLAGLSVPLVAAVWGWRSAFFASAVLALGLVAAVRPRPDANARAKTPSPPEPATRDTTPSNTALQPPGSAVTTGPIGAEPARQEGLNARSTLLVLTLAFAFANGASVTIPVFYVSAAVASGTPSGTAGAMLAAASIASIIARLTLGVITDRLVNSHLMVCAGMLAAGGVGFGLLASGHPLLGTIGVLVALAGSWGFSGVFWFTLVRAHPDAAGSITGKVAPGALVANSLTPLLFGFVAERLSYAIGWSISGVLAVCAAICMAVGSRMLSASQRH